jgi:class 3 adenylate cyclase/tetratricopeptide (TPR) repeat protein
MDVGGWLRGLGLGKYEAAFLDNGIGEAVLPHLTVEDLKEIGVATVGDRRMLLAAIAALATPPSSSIVPQHSPALPTKAPEVSAERRPITVMFCDLVGSTSLAAKLDAEDWRNLVNAYLDEASAAVTALGGHVLKKLGDGLMALFGYPQAQENDAERAVRAALAIQRALSEINAKNATRGAPELSARIGLESGPVVVETGGEVFGDAPNIAARVQAAAEPGSVLVTMNVQRQTAGLFVAEERGARELKGVSEPVQLFRITRASGARRRSSGRSLTPFVGREEELGLLARRWERTRTGDGQLTLIVGEPGLGKSRLIEEFHARLAETPHTWVEWSASQLLQNTPLHPIAEWGRLRFGVDGPAEQRLADLEGTLRLIGLDAVEHAPLLAPLMDIPLPPARAANLPPEELRRRQLAAMTNMVLAGARSQPVILAFEDLHWADPTSLDLLRALAERGAQAPLLLLATARPEFRAPWSLRSHHSVIALSPLDRAGVARMVGEISARHSLSKEVVEGVSERTGGVPLFVEEVTRLLLERGEQGGVQAIPPTLQQSLAARLDRLGPAREIAQIGAVLGREFGYPLLRDAAELDEPALQASLDRLAEADLLFTEGAPPQATYRFKHALIQDAAYDSLLKSRRQALHRRAAELLRDDPERAAVEPEVIAHHFTQAGLDDLAIEWWGRAGDQALRRSAFQEAIAHLGKAIAMADRAGSAAGPTGRGSAGQIRRLTQMQVTYGNALFATRGFGAPETTEAFERARQSALSEQDAPGRLAADWGLWASSSMRADVPAMRAHAVAFLSDVEPRPDSPEAGVAHRAAGITCWFAGEYREARDHLERALALFQPGRDDELTFRFGLDPGVAALVNLANVSWPLGEVNHAISLVDRMEARLADFTHGGLLAFARMYSAMFDLMRGDHARVGRKAFELARLAREHQLTMYGAFGTFLQSWVAVARGADSRGLAEMRRAVDELREQNVLLFDGLLKIALAEAEARAGDPDRAIAIVDEALATVDRLGYRAFEAELHRVRGEMLLKRDPTARAPAEEAFHTAIVVAKRQATRSFELRAALSLAMLYQLTHPAEANAVLAPALEGFSPTLEMPEIAEAQTLLAMLGETEEVKVAIASRRQRLHLQTSYGKAVMWSRGYAAEETKAAFARAQELATGVGNAADRFDVYYSQWAGCMVRGEPDLARATAESFIRDAKSDGTLPDLAAAFRTAGRACLCQGQFSQARAYLEDALRICDPQWDSEARRRHGTDCEISATAYLAHDVWQLGEVERARQLIDHAASRAVESGHIPTLANAYAFKTLFEMFRGDAQATLRDAETLVETAATNELAWFLNLGILMRGWARGRLSNRDVGTAELREVLGKFVESGNWGWVPNILGRLGELEAAGQDAEGALAHIDEALTLARRTGERWTDALLHRIRGDVLLAALPKNPASAEEAYLAALAIAQEQGARSFGLHAALALAKLYQLTGRPLDAHAVLAAALEGFAPTQEMPEVDEAQALLATLADAEEVKASETQRQRLAQLQVAYGNALFQARGYGSPETTEAFARARDTAAGGKDAPERLEADYGLWVGSSVRGELSAMRAHSGTFLTDVGPRSESPEAGVAHRIAGFTHWFAGEYREARDQLERAFASFQPGRDDDLAFRFGHDAGVAAMVHLGIALWPLGDVRRAASLIGSAEQRMAGLSHIGTHALWTMHSSMFELMRGDLSRVVPKAVQLARLTSEHDLPMWRAFGVFLEGLARGENGAIGDSLADMRRGAELLREQNVLIYDGLIKIALAQAEARASDLERAIATLDEALATVERAGFRAFEAELRRARGEMLLRRDPTDIASAEQALQTAVAIARRQGTRSFELRAALSLAKLYQTTARSVEAHAVLAPALEGFTPTPELAEIAEAQAVLAALAETDEVKDAIAQRQRRRDLQTYYGQALLWAKGFAAEETRAAFARVRELIGSDKDAAAHIAVYDAECLRSFMRGEYREAQAIAETLLREAEVDGRDPEAGAARRMVGLVRLYQGDLRTAQAILERELTEYQLGAAGEVAAAGFLALAEWHLGAVGHARQHIEQAIRRADESCDAATIGTALFFKIVLESRRDDVAATRLAAYTLLGLSEKHGMRTYSDEGQVYADWARSRGLDPDIGARELQQALTAYLAQGNKADAPSLHGLLAELEAAARRPESALALIDKGLAIAEETGEHFTNPYLHRLRGEILLKRDPANPASAEEAFQTAIAIAEEQGSRSYVLLASLSLAKLYQSTGRPLDAHAALAPALDGFSPTPEMPEIAQAQALLEQVALNTAPD